MLAWNRAHPDGTRKSAFHTEVLHLRIRQVDGVGSLSAPLFRKRQSSIGGFAVT